MTLYEIVSDNYSTIKKFNTKKRRVTFMIKENYNSEDLITHFKVAILQIIQHVTSTIQPNDRIGITFEFDGFKEKLPGFMTFRQATEVTFGNVWGILESILQSDPNALSSDKFRLIVTSVRPPVGKGRQRVYNNFEEECRQKRGIVSINNTDNLCLPRALVVAKALAKKDPNYNNIRKKQDVQKEKALKLIKKAGIANISSEGAGISELKVFQQHLQKYKITVYKYGAKGREILFEGPNGERKINLLYHQRHYNVISSLTSAFTCIYFCETCHIPYDHANDHRCVKKCICCGNTPPCVKQAMVLECAACKRNFNSQQCYENHKEKMCKEVKKCDKCFKTVNVKNRKHPHVCGEIYCKICQDHKPENHFCYMKQASKGNAKDTLFVFFDLETRQEKEGIDAVKLHEPNLCVLQQVCPKCYDETNLYCCKRCIMREKIFKDRCIERLMMHLLEMRKIFKKVVAIAHNGQAFDTQFILNYIITKTSIKPKLIMRGSKILMLEVDNLRFIDSLNYFPMSLSALPKSFGLPSHKGYFPHLFNTEANYTYVGTLPDVKYYSPDTMKPEARKEFLKWYNETKDNGYVFDLQRDLVDYCRTDVDILRRACIQFRNLFLEECEVDPFTESITIASACNLMFRRKFLQPETIGIIPRGGYRRADKQSKIALQWLIWEETTRVIRIQHAGRQKEVTVAGTKIDGYYENRVFQFHGCYYHGCPTCFTTRRDEPLHDDPGDTMEMRHEKTLACTEKLKSLGYDVVEMWECQFKKQFKGTPEMQQLEQHPMLVNAPLNPRDAFYGGRTGCTKLKYKVKPGEKIRYVDVCSLYPWVCKYGKFPIGHPTVHLGEDCKNLINVRGLKNIDGVIKCSILPPHHLYHPILPVKMHNKLMFPLCRTCTEDLNQGPCHHTDDERALNGTWIVDEVVRSVERGYKILDIQEVWNYNTTQYNKLTKIGGLFVKFIDKFLKMKQQASGWPSNCVMQGEKDQYIEDYLRNEGVRLEFSKITKNPGLRSLAKLMLNSFWGKFGQRENQPKTSIINEPKEFFDLMSNPSVEVNHIQEVNDETIVVNWQYKEEASDPLSSVNVVIASYVTTQARLKLYSYLEQLGERVLYYDTDSVIYVSREAEADLPTGSFLGDLTDELEEEYGAGSYITEFASGGPKNYAFKVCSPTTGEILTKIKVKGITLNHKTSQDITFDSMLSLLDDMDQKIIVECNNIRRTEDHQVITKLETKTYRINFLKRKRIEDYDSVPYGYKIAKNV